MKHFDSHPTILGLAALVAAFFLASCTSSHASMNPDARPAVLRYCFATTSEEPDAAAARLEIIKGYLSRTLHMPVEVTKTSNSYGGVIEAFRADKIDVASISPFSYVIATQKIPIEAIVMRGTKDGEPGEYRGSFVVPGNSLIQNIDDLIKHAKELTVSFVDPASTSGYLVENAFLQSKGIDAQRDFKKMVFSTNHLASFMTLKAGKVDVAAVAEKFVKRYIEMGKIAAGDVRIIWVSPDIPNQPIAVRKTLPAAFKEEIRRAFLDISEKDPIAFKNLYSSQNAALATPGQVYVPANDAMFDGLRKMARSIKDLSLLEQ